VLRRCHRTLVAGRCGPPGRLLPGLLRACAAVPGFLRSLSLDRLPLLSWLDPPSWAGPLTILKSFGIPPGPTSAQHRPQNFTLRCAIEQIPRVCTMRDAMPSHFPNSMSMSVLCPLEWLPLCLCHVSLCATLCGCQSMLHYSYCNIKCTSMAAVPAVWLCQLCQLCQLCAAVCSCVQLCAAVCNCAAVLLCVAVCSCVQLCSCAAVLAVQLCWLCGCARLCWLCGCAGCASMLCQLCGSARLCGSVGTSDR
jgi:hypothetical protein